MYKKGRLYMTFYKRMIDIGAFIKKKEYRYKYHKIGRDSVSYYFFM